MFVDASALVAILTNEPEAARLLAAVDFGSSVITSPIAIYEATLAIRRKRVATVAETLRDVMEFIIVARIRIVPISSEAGVAALDAFARYGKGQGHPAQLNMGDCFAYAAARGADVPMLFVGQDFTQTDIRSALS